MTDDKANGYVGAIEKYEEKRFNLTALETKQLYRPKNTMKLFVR